MYGAWTGLLPRAIKVRSGSKPGRSISVQRTAGVDQQILVKIDGVVVRRRHIRVGAQERPRPRPEERLAAHRGECRLDARMSRIAPHRDLLGISAAHDRQLGLGHRLLLSARDDDKRQS